jgi:hypothetical protein
MGPSDWQLPGSGVLKLTIDSSALSPSLLQPSGLARVRLRAWVHAHALGASGLGVTGGALDAGWPAIGWGSALTIFRSSARVLDSASWLDAPA